MHDFAHGTGKIAVFVGFGNAGFGSEKAVPQRGRGVACAEHASVALVHKTGAAAGNVDQLADQIRVDLVDKVIQVQVQIFHTAPQLGGVVVTQVFGLQMFQIGTGPDEGAA